MSQVEEDEGEENGEAVELEFSLEGTSLTTNIPDTTQPGNVFIIVTNPDGADTATFTVLASPDAPTITAIDPTSGAVGDEVVITGTNLNQLEAVMFGDIEADVDEAASNAITFTVPADAQTGPITVITAEGTVESEEDFTVTTTE